MERETNYSPKTAEQAGLTASAKPACGFQADPLLSEQYLTGRRNIRLEPEKRLMLAILEEAVYCFQDNYPAQHGKGKRLFDSAHRWFFGQSGDWIFSFENVCSVLGLDPGYVRKGLAQWTEKETAKRPCAASSQNESHTREKRTMMRHFVGEGFTELNGGQLEWTQIF